MVKPSSRCGATNGGVIYAHLRFGLSNVSGKRPKPINRELYSRMVSLNGRKQIVILGGGCGGVVAATQLGRKLGADHDVTLIDRRADHIFMPAFLFVMLGERQPRDISRSLSHLQKRNVKVIQSEIRGIDPIRQEVSLEKEKVSYDYLIVSLG